MIFETNCKQVFCPGLLKIHDQNVKQLLYASGESLYTYCKKQYFGNSKSVTSQESRIQSLNADNFEESFICEFPSILSTFHQGTCRVVAMSFRFVVCVVVVALSLNTMSRLEKHSTCQRHIWSDRKAYFSKGNGGRQAGR